MKLQEVAIFFLLIISFKIKISNPQGLAIVSEIAEFSRKGGVKQSDEKGQFVPEKHVKDQQRSYENYSSIYEIAKNISHSKGIFIDKNGNKSDDKVQLRRSVSRKLARNFEFELVENHLHSFQRETGNIKLFNLQQIEFLVHEYDVAVHFAKIGGIELMLPHLQSSDDELVSATAIVLGTAMQSNPDVQKHAVNLKVGDSLLECLKSSKNSTSSRILFALSAYLRNMPEAQGMFYQSEGIFIFSTLLRNSTIAIKAKLRIVDLLHDLSIEHQINEDDVRPEDFQRLQDLKVILETDIKKSEICKEVPHLLNQINYNVHQKVIAAMRAMTPFCFQVFQNMQVLQNINSVLSYYGSEREELSNYQIVGILIDYDLKKLMSEEINLLLKYISTFAKEKKKKINVKDEL